MAVVKEELTVEEQQLAKRVLESLRVRSRFITNPMTNAEIIELARSAGVVISERTLRHLTNWLRKNGYPCGYNDKGHYYVRTAAEFDVAIKFVTDKARDLEEQIRAMREAREKLLLKENGPPPDLFNHPVVEAIKEKFGAVVVP